MWLLEKISALFARCAGYRKLNSAPTNQASGTVNGARDHAAPSPESEPILATTSVEELVNDTPTGERPITSLQLNEESETSSPDASSTSSSENGDSGTNTQASSVNAVDSDGEDHDEELDKWGPLQAIPNLAFAKLAARLAGSTADDGPFVVERRSHGYFSLAVIVSNCTNKLVIKVPVTGVPDRWQPQHAHIMRAEVHLMMYIKHCIPDFPVATIFGYDVGFENEINAPFSCQSFLPGKPATELWYDLDAEEEETGDAEPAGPRYYDSDDSDAGANDPYWEDAPSSEREQLRISVLQSVAKEMAKLRHISQYDAGMLYLEDDDPEEAFIGPIRGFSGDFFLESRMYWTLDDCDTAEQFFTSRLNHKCNRTTSIEIIKGRQMILDIIFGSAPFSTSKTSPDDEQEEFTLLHPDLDLQNILVNDDGQVTGIIDWEGAFFVPRCVGHTAVPTWLRKDWQEHCRADHAQRLDDYRKVYADAMMEACGGPDSDAKFTYMSGLYGTAQYMLYSNWAPPFAKQAHFLIKKLLVQIPELRDVKLHTLLKSVGGGSPEELKILEEWIPKLLEPRTG